MAMRIGPGVAIPVVFLSPGVLNADGKPMRTRRAGRATHPDPAASAAAHGPATQATSSIPNRVTDEAGVSYGLGPATPDREADGSISDQTYTRSR